MDVELDVGWWMWGTSVPQVVSPASLKALGRAELAGVDVGWNS